MSSRRLGGFAGLAFLSAVIPVNIILGTVHLPRAGATKGEVLTFFADHDAVIGITTTLATVAWLSLALFTAGIVAASRAHERRSGDSWSLLALGGAIMQNAIFAGVAAMQVTLGIADLSDDVAWGLWQLHNALFGLNVVALAIVMIGGSVGGHRAGLLADWQRRLGLVAAATVFASAALVPVTLDGHPLGLVGLAGFVLWLVWIASVSASLLRGSDRRVDGASASVAVNA